MAPVRFSNEEAKHPRKALSRSISTLDIRDMARNIRDLADFFRTTTTPASHPTRHVPSSEPLRKADAPNLRRAQSMQSMPLPASPTAQLSPADSAISMNTEDHQWPERTSSRGALRLSNRPSAENERVLSGSSAATPTTLHSVHEGVELENPASPTRSLASVRPSLAIPMETPLPESPAFPMKPSAFAFPSPPSSPADSLNSWTKNSPSDGIKTASPIESRTTALQPGRGNPAQARPSTPPPSLDDMVISVRHVKSDSTLRAFAASGSPITSGTITPKPAGGNEQSFMPGKSRPESWATFFTARSTRSNSNHSTLTNDDSSHLEAPLYNPTKPSAHMQQLDTIGLSRNEAVGGTVTAADKTPGRNYRRPTVSVVKPSQGGNIHSSPSKQHEDPASLTIAQRRRMARNNKLTGSTRGGSRSSSPAPSVSESSDSPVRGRLPSSETSPPRSSLRGFLLVADKPRGESVSSLEGRGCQGTSTDLSTTTAKVKQAGVDIEPPMIRSLIPSTSHKEWSISAVMVTETIPEAAPQQDNTLTMSTVMVIADIESVCSSVPDSVPSSASSSPAPRFSRIMHKRSESPIPLPIRRSDSTTAVPLRPGLRGHLNARPMRHSKPPPISIARNPSTGAIERHTIERHPPAGAMGAIERRMSMLKVAHPALSEVPTPPLTPEDRVSRRFTMPARPATAAAVTHPNPSWVHPDIPEETTTQESEAAEESESDESDEIDAKTRDMLLMERLRAKKLEKQREIDEMVDRTLASASQHREKSHNDERSYQDKVQSANTQDIELRLNRLEKSGDEWLNMMTPLLDSMNRTLEYMQTDKVGRRASGSYAQLTMQDFNIDMEAEATPCMTMRMQTRNGPASSRESSETMRWQSHPVRGEKGRKMTRPNLPNLTNLRIDIDKSVPTIPGDPAGTESTKPDGPNNEQSSGNQPLKSPRTPRTPLEHEFEAQAAIQKRMKDQLSMMDELINKWGTPSSLRPDSSSGSRLGSSSSRRTVGSASKGLINITTSNSGVSLSGSRGPEKSENSIDPAPRDINNKLLSRLT